MKSLFMLIGELRAWRDANLFLCRSACVVLVLAAFVCEAIGFYNLDMHDLNLIAEKRSQIGKEFRRREDLERNMGSIVSLYARHEQVLFRHVCDMRAQVQSLGTPGGAPAEKRREKIEADMMRLVALEEQYPELKAERGFRELMDTTEATEDRIAAGMKDYLGIVFEYNAGNQGIWNNFYFYPVTKLVPLPGHWEYFYTEHSLGSGVAAADASAGGGKRDMRAGGPVPYDDP